jgi:hypothetical protein
MSRLLGRLLCRLSVHDEVFNPEGRVGLYIGPPVPMICRRCGMTWLDWQD